MNSRMMSSALSVLKPTALCLALSGCVFGENKQFFETSASDTNVGAILGGIQIASPTPNPTMTPNPSPTASPEPSPSATPASTPVATPSASPTPAASASPTPIASATPTPSPAASATPCASATPTPNSNHSPIAHDDGPYEIGENQNLRIAISDLLLNDSDPQGLPIRFDSFQNPSSGSILRSGDQLIFQASALFNGSVSFQYQISNSQNLTASAQVSIQVRKSATEAIYGHSNFTLYKYDGITHTSEPIAEFRRENGAHINVFDIAITPAGLMYAVNGAALFYVDAATGVLSEVPTPGIEHFGNINGLTALSDGRIVLSGNGVAIYNVATQTLTTLLEPRSYESAGDVIALPDGYLYLSAIANANNHLIKVDPNTGATVDLGSLNHKGVYGLGYAYGTFYGFASSGLVFEIDPNNAHTQDIGNAGITWYGATTNPVLW